MLRHAPRGHCGSSVGSRKANEERLPTTGVGDRSQIVCLGRASWSAGAGCCVFVLLFLAAMRIRRRGIWQWHGEKLWQVAWRVFCSVSGLRPLRLGPAPVLGVRMCSAVRLVFLLRLASVPSGWGQRQFVCLLCGVELCSTAVSIISFTPHSEWVESPMLWHG